MFRNHNVSRRRLHTGAGVASTVAFGALLLTLWLTSGSPSSLLSGGANGRDESVTAAGTARAESDDGGKATAQGPDRADGSTAAAATVSRALPRDVLPIHTKTMTRREIQQGLLAGALSGNAAIDSTWDHVLFGRYLAIDDFVDYYSGYYGTDFIWQLAAYCSESIMDPLAKGPDFDGDKGLGQVAKESERIARIWASDPENPYYVETYDPSRSVWDPETNVILSTIVLRSLYAMPVVTSNEKAYGHLTVGLGAVDGNGNLVPRAARRVERAASFLDKLIGFVGLKLAYAPASPGGSEQHTQSAEATFETVSARQQDAIVRRLLAIDRAHGDGLPITVALRDYYLELSQTANGPWNEALYFGEAVNLARVADEVYDLPSGVAWKALRQRAGELAGAVYATGDQSLIGYFSAIEARIPG